MPFKSNWKDHRYLLAGSDRQRQTISPLVTIRRASRRRRSRGCCNGRSRGDSGIPVGEWPDTIIQPRSQVGAPRIDRWVDLFKEIDTDTVVKGDLLAVVSTVDLIEFTALRGRPEGRGTRWSCGGGCKAWSGRSRPRNRRRGVFDPRGSNTYIRVWDKVRAVLVYRWVVANQLCEGETMCRRDSGAVVIRLH